MNNAFESIQQGLMEAIEFGKGETKDATVHKSSSDEAKAVVRVCLDLIADTAPRGSHIELDLQVYP